MIDMSEHMPKDMPDRMPEDMSEDMSDRIPEDMSTGNHVQHCGSIGMAKRSELLVFCVFSSYVHRKSCSALREHWNGKAKRIAESNEAGRQRARRVQRPQDTQEDQDEEMKEEARESQTPAESESTGAPTLYWGGFLLELHKRLGEGVVWAAKSMGHSVAVKIPKSTDGLQEHSALTFRSFFSLNLV